MSIDAAVAADAPPGLTDLAQYGAIGVLCALFVWFAFKAWQRETTRADRLEAEVTRLNTTIQDQAIPALLAAADAIKECTELLRDQRHDRWRDTHPAAGRRDGDQR